MIQKIDVFHWMYNIAGLRKIQRNGNCIVFKSNEKERKREKLSTQYNQSQGSFEERNQFSICLPLRVLNE
jgi:hypothetical protein